MFLRYGIHEVRKVELNCISGKNNLAFVNNAVITRGSIGKDTSINSESKPFVTKLYIQSGKIVKFNQYLGFRQYITVSTDGISRCDATVQWVPNPGHQLLESTMTDGVERLFAAHAENINCTISNK